MIQIHEHAARSIARATLPQLTAWLDMAEDALLVEDNPAAPMLSALSAAYQARISQLRGIGDTRPADDADVTVGRKAGSAAPNQYGTFAVHYASEKQVAFLQRLLNEKNTDGVKVPTTLEGISKTSASALIDKLVDRPAKAEAATSGARLASEKQVAFLVKLAHEKVLSNMANGEALKDAAYVAKMTSKDASQTIDFLMGQHNLPKAPVAEIAAGAYRVQGRIVRVYLGQQSGKMLAAELVDATATSRDDAWHYLGMASRFIDADAHRLTVEECEEAAGASGASFTWCYVCGRRLDDPNSVNRQIGPVCRAKQGA